ncbi:tol-pal system-associated acyl-CoA thioesterase [Candidatus Symbiopectobacterium sp. NZEC151]|uniref:tol-pal system-associated acyl-CoA thioesterase n=1 Tax=Candidatus Symbiopectobacterium sp. NZEC151 TaxID=2820470 RepID=UPI002227B077|nr:tol-pal system-associated acyl-CoA thioesterase [Candidatus Symbiopectobacterium sp. NZEC151]
MKTAVGHIFSQALPAWLTQRGAFSAFSRSMLTALVLTAGLVTSAGLSGNAFAAPASTPVANAAAASAPQAAATASTPLAAESAVAGAAAVPASPLALPQGSAGNIMKTDLSVWGMYQHADLVVKSVMIGLLLASVITWAIFFGKSVELLGAKRRLRREYAALEQARTLDDAADVVEAFKADSTAAILLADAQNELTLSARSDDNNGIKERTAFRLERRVAAAGRHMGRGNGYLATVGAVAPFVGLFGTVWGIMNSFIGIAQTQTTNLAVVAPGIAEALLATAVGLVAAIPAVVIYNVFARGIGSYKALMGDVAAQVLLLVSRDLDVAASNGNRLTAANQKLRVG